MGLSPQVFWSMSLKEFKLCQRGFFEKRKQDIRVQWETARYVAFYAVAPHAKKGRMRKLTDLGLFEWEKGKGEPQYLTEEQLRYISLKHGLFIGKDGKRYNA